MPPVESIVLLFFFFYFPGVVGGRVGFEVRGGVCVAASPLRHGFVDTRAGASRTGNSLMDLADSGPGVKTVGEALAFSRSL